MKTLLVAVDFSKNSIHALEYAIVYANKLGARLYLIWVDSSQINEGMADTIAGELRIESKALLDSLVKEYQGQTPEGKVHLILRRGKVYQEVAKAAQKIEADMIFAGTHGVSGYEQYWIGSNAYRIVAQAPCPIVTIRSQYEIHPNIKNFLLPLDSTLETREKLPMVAQLARDFNATIHLLEVYNTPISLIRKRIAKFSEEAVNCLSDKNVSFVVEKTEADNVAVSIQKYAESHHIDLISIMTDQGTTSANKFLGAYSQQLINNSVIPILSVRAKETH
ncbi:MAG: universal stress protein [Bacteroidales bacterium]|jgi:nucleotide-binding universal stress UspA family protein